MKPATEHTDKTLFSHETHVGVAWEMWTRGDFLVPHLNGEAYSHKPPRMQNVAFTPVETLRRAAAIGRAAGLRYVYEGNVPGEPGENTNCYRCGVLLIERYGFHVRVNCIRDGACPDCGARIDGVGLG